VLALVLVVQLYLFAGFHWERWSKALARRDNPRARLGEGLVIRCDGLGYYAWLRSLLIDGDLSFDNEFDEHNILGDYVPGAGDRTPAGERANPWSVGPGCVWALAIIPGHLALRAFEQTGLPWPVDGYALPYQLLVGLTTVAVSWSGLILLYRICRRFAAPRPAALAAACLTLGTTLVYYNTLEVSMAHGLGAAALAGFIDYWLATYGTTRSRRWVTAGLLLGVAMLMRWQLAGFAILLLGEAFGTVNRRALGKSIARLLLASAGATLAFSPQLLAWHLVYGRWLAQPIPVNPNWLHPAWRQILFDRDRGLFYWTPLAIVAFLAAMALTFSRHRSMLPGTASPIPGRQPAWLLVFGALLQVYLVAALWGPTVYLGAAFGMRHLTETLVALGPGLAWLIDRRRQAVFRIVAGCVILLVFWNLLLVSLYRYAWIPAAGGADPDHLLGLSLKLVQRKRFLLVGQALAAPLLLGIWALAGAGAKASAPFYLRGRSSRCRVGTLASPAGSPKIAELIPQSS
jgi:hypothetical protein